MAFDDPALLTEFVTESREHLADVEGQFLEIEAAGADIDVDLVNTVFRAIHSIKGAAGFMGLTTVNKLAHSLENVLGKMRNVELIPTSEIVDVMLKAADQLTGLINDIENSNEVDVSSHISALDNILANGSADVGQSEEAAETQTGHVEGNGEVPVDAQEAPNKAKEPVAQPTQDAVKPPQNKGKASSRPAPAAAPAAETSIRVQVGVLDSLMNLAGELVLGRNQLLQTISSEDQSGVQTVAARLDQVTSELQEAIMQTRMQPIGNVFGKFPRVVRDLSAKLGKQCNVVMEGKDVEVDKTIIEAIGDPLTHLVRNSVDHGLEGPEDRTAAGKEADGTVTLRAYHQAGKVRIDIVDDGAGIDPNKLKQKALEKGVITQDRADEMTDRDAVRLIFHPGFSTAEKLSDVSGRGVGMDVVRTNIERIGGTVDVESQIGVGTSICISLPLTLAIIPSMIVRCCGERYAIPQLNIVELVRVRMSELDQHINSVKDARVLRLRGSLLPLVELDRALRLADDHEASTAQVAKHIIVVESGQTRYGLVVDEMDDSEEIVVKPLGKHLKSCGCLAGATILGDGHVAPILDVAGIASGCDLNISSDSEEHELIAQESSDTRERQSLLLFSNGPSEHFAVPMSLIARIERIRTDCLDTIGGQEVVQYRGVSLPLISVERFITASDREAREYLHVVVFTIQGKEVGLVAPELNDIQDIAADIDGDTLRENGVAGSFVFDEQTIRLLDLYGLAKAAFPEWFSNQTQIVPEDQNHPTILLAEDSAFFRNQVKQYLESEGFDVEECEDGQEAWEYLSEEHEKIDLLITDIEMPRMDGFQLTSNIKKDPTLRKIPVIALTSLASDEDRKRGDDAGIDEYQVKLDREKVMTAVQSLLNLSPSRSKQHQPQIEANAQECLV